MAYDYLELATTLSVGAAQAADCSDGLWAGFKGERPSDRFTEAETRFVAERDSFYIATLSETGWPYVQHRGGPPGFLHVLDERTLAFADYRGNRQFISVGNLAANDRASLILMDYPGRRRLKIFARVEIKGLEQHPELAASFAVPNYRAKPERVALLHVSAFDWNCPRHITPRYTEAEVAAAVAPIRDRLRSLEDENAELHRRLAVAGSAGTTPPDPSSDALADGARDRSAA